MQSWDRFAWYLSSSSRCLWPSTVSQPDSRSLQSKVLWPICAIFSFPTSHFGLPLACHFDIHRALRQHSHYRQLHWLAVCLVIISSTRTWTWDHCHAYLVCLVTFSKSHSAWKRSTSPHSKCCQNGLVSRIFAPFQNLASREPTLPKSGARSPNKSELGHRRPQTRAFACQSDQTRWRATRQRQGLPRRAWPSLRPNHFH